MLIQTICLQVINGDLTPTYRHKGYRPTLGKVSNTLTPQEYRGSSKEPWCQEVIQILQQVGHIKETYREWLVQWDDIMHVIRKKINFTTEEFSNVLYKGGVLLKEITNLILFSMYIPVYAFFIISYNTGCINWYFFTLLIRHGYEFDVLIAAISFSPQHQVDVVLTTGEVSQELQGQVPHVLMVPNVPYSALQSICVASEITMATYITDISLVKKQL